MRQLKVYVEIELQVLDSVSDEEVYEAICRPFFGVDGDGLPDDTGKVVAPYAKLQIYREPTKPESVWGCS